MGLPGVGRGSSSARTAAPRHCWLCHVHHAMNANFPGSSRRESASKGQCDAQRGLPPVTAMIAELIATIEMPATRPAKRAMRWSFAVYARAELMKVLPEPGSIDPVRAQPVVRSARVRGGCPAHGGRVRPAACSFCMSLRSAWSLHIQIRPSSAPGSAKCNRASWRGCVSYFTLATFSGRVAATRPREGPRVRSPPSPYQSQAILRVLRPRSQPVCTPKHHFAPL